MLPGFQHTVLFGVPRLWLYKFVLSRRADLAFACFTNVFAQCPLRKTQQLHVTNVEFFKNCVSQPSCRVHKVFKCVKINCVFFLISLNNLNILFFLLFIF